MLYLSGCVRPVLEHPRPHLGVMLQPRMRHLTPLTGVTWAADNGCFAGAFDASRWTAWLGRWQMAQKTCLFAVAPDVVGYAEETIARSTPYLPVIRALGYRAALVAQDGLERLLVDWDGFDALFIGGTTAWKLSDHARLLVQQARVAGKWVHMGRVNSYRRLALAALWGCHSADGTFLRYAPKTNVPRMDRWFEQLHAGGSHDRSAGEEAGGGGERQAGAVGVRGVGV